MFRSPIGLDVEVPEPLHVFNAATTHPDNERLLLAARDARLLTPEQVKAAKLKRDALRLALARLGWDQIRADLEAVKTTYREYKQDMHRLNLECMDAPADQQQRIANEIRQLKDDSAVVVENYRRMWQHVKQPRKPLLYKPGLFAGAVQRKTAEILATNTPLLRMARQLQHIEQRLAEHQEAVEHKRQQDILINEMAKEARLFARIVQERWAALGYCYRFQINRGGRVRTVTKLVRFRRVEVTEDQIHLMVDATRLGLFGETHNLVPNGVRLGDLIKPDVLDELTMACQRTVTSPHVSDSVDFTNGCWLTINRMGSTDGLMDYIELAQVMATYRRDWHESVPVPMGVRRGRVVNWVRLSKTPHMLVAGQTGTGKSNVFYVFITSIIKMHSPDEVRLILCDLKEGISFDAFKTIPHLLGDVISEVDPLHTVLLQLEKLRAERTIKMRGIARDIDEYNAVVSPEHRMPRIILVVDEYHQVSAAGVDVRNGVHSLVAQIAAKGRSAGVHLFLGTQASLVELLPGKIKMNITYTLSGRQSNMGASVTTMGSKALTRLPDVPGRMLISAGGDPFPVQIPYVTQADIKDALETAQTYEFRPFNLPPIDGEDGEPVAVFDEHTLIDYALEHLEGALKGRLLWEGFSKQFGVSLDKTYKMVEEITASDTIEHRGKTYKLARERKYFVLMEQEPEGVIS